MSYGKGRSGKEESRRRERGWARLEVTGMERPGKHHRVIKDNTIHDRGGQHMPLRCEGGAPPTTTPGRQRQEDCLDQHTSSRLMGIGHSNSLHFHANFHALKLGKNSWKVTDL